SYGEWSALGRDVVSVNDVREFYVEGVLKLVDVERIRSRRFKVVVDPANNVGSLTTPQLLRRLGVKVATINSEITHVPARTPEPTPESLGMLSRTVRVVNADLGVAHDGDADRAVFVDNEGEVLPGDRTAVLLCSHIARNRKDRTPRKVYTAVSSSTIVEDYLRGLGVEVVWTKVGSVTIAREMLRHGAMAGFEENGGFMYPPHQFVRDGAMSAALMLEFLATEGISLRDAANSLPRRHLIKTKLPLRGRERLGLLYEELRKAFSSGRAVDVDGIKIIGEGYWFLVRPSGTEPILRVFVEAGSKEEAEKLLNSVVSIVKQVLG
ncbi:MAG: phosphoglucosamine mutase, partial [Desulfurococcales archaeon]|nr:phosphoglucosamine mutase [Desulfurococcales archaeon]